MGAKDWLQRLKDKAEESLRKAEDPAELKKQKKEDNAKKIARAAKAIKLAQKGMEIQDDLNKKADAVKKAATEKALDAVEKIEPVADKVDAAAQGLKDKVTDLFGKAVQKAEDIKKSEEQKPSTGSTILDIISPPIPENDQTKRSDKPQPKQDVPPAP